MLIFLKLSSEVQDLIKILLNSSGLLGETLGLIHFFDLSGTVSVAYFLYLVVPTMFPYCAFVYRTCEGVG